DLKLFVNHAKNVQELIDGLKRELRIDNTLLKTSTERKWNNLKTQSIKKASFMSWVQDMKRTYTQLSDLKSGIISGWTPYIDVIEKARTINRSVATGYEI